MLPSTTVIFCSDTIAPRIAYMAHWLGQYLFGMPLTPVVSSMYQPQHEDAVVYYGQSKPAFPCFFIPAHGLLHQKGIQPQQTDMGQWLGLPIFFQTTGGDPPFDLPAAVFYLISRYEEYLPYTPDMYGRYPHEGSLAFRQGFLKRPIADEWMEQLKGLLLQRFPQLQFAPRQFTYLPTYDVDMAWCYREKGLLRNGAGLLRQLFAGKWQDLFHRLQVLAGRRPDPFDVFDDLDKLHNTYKLKPQYFFLLAPKNKGYDRNILPHKPRFRALVHRLANRYVAGIHFSWQAHTNSSFEAEQAQLAQITGKSVQSNRFHYIRMWLPVSYRQLLALPAPITEDHSMGYGSINGFRASSCTPFFWYDLEAEAATGLRVYPFAYMEANSIFEQKNSPDEALAEWQALYSKVHAVGGTFVTIVHNHMIGTDADGRRWWQVYQSFLQRNFG